MDEVGVEADAPEVHLRSDVHHLFFHGRDEVTDGLGEVIKGTAQGGEGIELVSEEGGESVGIIGRLLVRIGEEAESGDGLLGKGEREGAGEGGEGLGETEEGGRLTEVEERLGEEPVGVQGEDGEGELGREDDFPFEEITVRKLKSHLYLAGVRDLDGLFGVHGISDGTDAEEGVTGVDVGSHGGEVERRRGEESDEEERHRYGVVRSSSDCGQTVPRTRSRTRS